MNLFLKRIEIETVKKNSKLMKNHLPPNIRYEFINAEKVFKNPNQNNDDRKIFSLRKFYLKNVFKNTQANMVERMCFLISGIIPSNCTNTDLDKGIWLIEFQSDFGKFFCRTN